MVLRVRSLKPNMVLKCASGSGVEHHLAKVGAAGSNPVSRFSFYLIGRDPASGGRHGLFCVMRNVVSHDTKASGGRRAPRRGRWLLTQSRSGAGVRQAHTFFKENFHKSRSFFSMGKGKKKG